jgi:hypothetical protein
MHPERQLGLELAFGLCAAASSSASTLGVPSMTPESISAWRCHRNSVGVKDPRLGHEYAYHPEHIEQI